MSNGNDFAKHILETTWSCPSCNKTSPSSQKVFSGGIKCFSCDKFTSYKELCSLYNGSENYEEYKYTINKENLLDSNFIELVYTYLIEKLKLKRSHKQILLNRGLTLDVIEKENFRSAEDLGLEFLKGYDYLHSQYIIYTGTDNLEKYEHALLGVPGVYRDKDTSEIKFNSYKGILIPIYENDRLLGLQINSINPTNNAPKYFWVSSTNKGGNSPGAPADIKNNIYNNFTKTAIITEGKYKSLFLQKNIKAKYYVSIQGITNIKRAINFILEDSSNIDTIILCLDMDMLTNENVLRAADNIQKELKDFSFKYIYWNYSQDNDKLKKQKGFDDLPSKDMIINPQNYVITEDNYRKYKIVENKNKYITGDNNEQ